MRRRCQFISLATFTFLLSLGAPQFPTVFFLPAAQASQDRRVGADRLLRQSMQAFPVSQAETGWQSLAGNWKPDQEGKDQQGEGSLLNGGTGLAPMSALMAQATENRNATGTKSAEASRLVEAGVKLYKEGKKQEAINLLEQAIKLLREIKDKKNEALILDTVAVMQSDLGQHMKALESLRQALAIHRELKDRKSEGQTLYGIGIMYDRLNQYPQALEFLQQALPFHRELKDRKSEGQTLRDIGELYRKITQYSKAIEFLQQALVIRKDLGDRQGQIESLISLGTSLSAIARHPQSLEAFQQALTLSRELGNRKQEAKALSGIGFFYRRNDYPKALDFYQRALLIRKEISDRPSVGSSLSDIGSVYYALSQYTKSLDYHQQALAIHKEVGDRQGESTSLNEIGLIYYALSQYAKSLDYYQRSLLIAKEIGARQGESASLGNIGLVYSALSQYAKALDYYQRSLLIKKEIGDRQGEGALLVNIGSEYKSLGQYAKALDYYKQSVAIYKEIGDRSVESSSLGSTGSVHQELGEYSKALDYHQQSLAIRKEIGDRSGESASLNNIGLAYDSLSQYAKALDYHQQSLAIRKEIGDRSGESISLNNIGIVYQRLGQYSKALDYLQQSLAISKEIGDRFGESTALTNIGTVYRKLGKNSEALNYYQQSLVIQQAIGSRWGEGFSLDFIGAVYRQMGQYAKALDYHQRSLSIRQELGEKRGEGIALDNLGLVYQGLGQPAPALDFFQRALVVRQSIGDSQGEAETLSNLAAIFKQQDQPELAITFYKQSVNSFETIRGGVRQLPREFQESYTQSLSTTYRNLADLLIQQGRLSEAQAVLELLKLRELREFTRDGGINSTGISLAKVEEAALKQILAQFTTVGNFTQKLAECQQTNCPTLRQLEQQRDTLNTAVQEEMKQQRAILAKHFSTEESTLTPDKLNAEARRIVNAQPGTVLIYPLVLKDKIQFLVAFQAGNGAVTFRPFETKVSADQLFKTIQTFRDQLSSPDDLKKLQATSQTLYNALIKPLEAELRNSQIKHLVFAPDSSTRYIPLAALYDGQQYLMQRFTVSTITAASQTDTVARSPTPTGQTPLLLAMGASTFPNQNPLPNVPAELDAITRSQSASDRQGTYPGSKFLNGTFDYAALQTSLKTGTYRILHLATHGAFQPGRVEESYLVPGRGQNLTTELIDQLGNYGLGSIHLVVLSACQTAVGDRASDGMEIPGISYFFLKNSVKSVLASLWNVNDASTALIMQQFYKNLATGMTKAEALRQAQLSLLQGKVTAKDAPARSPTLIPKGNPQTRQSANGDFSHPYYWAPFILIGNSL